MVDAGGAADRICVAKWGRRATVPDSEPGWRGSSRPFQPGSTSFDLFRSLAQMAFRGFFDTTLDAKNRLTIPVKQRRPLEQGAVVALQQDAKRCIAIWCTEDFNAYVDGLIDGMHPLSPDRVKLERYFHAYSTEVELDSAGRVMLPGPLLEQAGIGREITLIGARSRLEVWDRDAWRLASDDMLN